jgi:hypothetical protein
MYSLTIAFGETPAMWRLLFKTEEAAQKAVATLEQIIQNPHPENVAEMMDDFGQLCAIKWNGILGWMLEDLDQSKQAGVEMQIHNWKMQAEAQTKGAAMAELRPLRGGGQSPAVFVPGMNGRMS